MSFHGEISMGEASCPADEASVRAEARTDRALDVPIAEAANDSLRADDAAMLTALPDGALMREVGTGSAAAFAVLVERHTPALYRVAMRMLSDGHEAEDVVQECFVRLWQHAPRWQPSGAGLVGWLHRIAMNLCFDRKRRFRVVTTPELPDMADEAPLADEIIASEQAHGAVANALADLSERYRAALVLCYYEGFTNALAAEVLALNIKAMESLLFRARRQMRDLLEARDVAWRDVAAGAGLRA